jgi:hypothetical protein
MSLAIYEYQSMFDHRVFVNPAIKSGELERVVNTNYHKYFGASIKSYHSFAGPFLKILGIATIWQEEQKIYYLNTKSLQKYFYRLFTIAPGHSDIEKIVMDKNAFLNLPISKSAHYYCSSSFKMNPLNWMTLMTSRYIFFMKNGYQNTVLEKLNPDFLVKALSGKI